MTEKSPKTAVLLVNLGTPEAATASALKPYLKEFLSDRRVVDLNPFLWKTLLNLVILPFRGPQSAQRYAQIWMKEGSPLKVYTDRIARKLRERLKASAGPDIKVAVGMRYGKPSQVEVLKSLHLAGYDHILVLPLYPQYSSSTTASVMDAVSKALSEMRSQPKFFFVRDYHDHPLYIRALAESIRAHWKKHGELGERGRLVLSFHGIPERYRDEGDPYPKQAEETAHLLIQELGVEPNQVVFAYQSRFGKEEWVKPYTASAVAALARDGIDRIDVVCPGFHTDCLETLEEIGLELQEEFKGAGGSEFHYIPCLNDSSSSVDLLESIVRENLRSFSE